MLTLSTAALVWAFLTDDFSVAYVANHSNTKLAPAYKAAALWGSHEGSMLLWIWLMAVGMAWAGSSDRPAAASTARLHRADACGARGFCVFRSSRRNPLPAQPATARAPHGRDLNPILQDIGMIRTARLFIQAMRGLALMFAAHAARLPFGRRSKTAIDSADASFHCPPGLPDGGQHARILVGLQRARLGRLAGSESRFRMRSFIPWLTTTALMHALIQTVGEGN